MGLNNILIRKGFTMKSPVQQEIDQIDNDERNAIKVRIKALKDQGISLNQIVMGSQLTSLPNYLNGGKIHTGTMFVFNRYITRLEKQLEADAKLRNEQNAAGQQ
jgi:hypothetical protein